MSFVRRRSEDVSSDVKGVGQEGGGGRSIRWWRADVAEVRIGI